VCGSNDCGGCGQPPPGSTADENFNAALETRLEALQQMKAVAYSADREQK